ncbi:hypothetical protein HMPREF0663_10098 [Hoylesella oralis ATCC 33269]|uniref:Uncharacterized protein n=1 Tax=Hoylesella oralis ATCC 33269 TaxID=873533 RepID=E7RLU8_9BACT|nr:hypothetical protein HMPREF0663_10098 [Hoylesella oralis ATCC 33269]
MLVKGINSIRISRHDRHVQILVKDANLTFKLRNKNSFYEH